jgi:serine/threonine protein kinase
MFHAHGGTALTRVQPNILVDAAGHAQITDFGLARVTQNLDSIRSASGDQGHTPRWTSPEILNEEGTYSKEADVFSFAMVMIEVRHIKRLFWSTLGLPPPRTIHRRLPAQSPSTIAYLQRPCWQ